MFLFKTNPTSSGRRWAQFLKISKLKKKNTINFFNYLMINFFYIYKILKFHFLKITNFLNLLSLIVIIYKNKTKNLILQKYSCNSLMWQYGISGLFLLDFIFPYYSIFIKNSKFWLGIITYLFFILPNFFISNIQITNLINKFIISSNGTFATLIPYFYEISFSKILLPSWNIIILKKKNKCIMGRNNNIFFKFTNFGKAGFLNKFHKKLSVRGVAKNPVDHPHGGRTKTNKPEVSMWGWIAKYSH